MKTIIAEFEIVTPMFLAGADQQKAELRVSAIKAELVFWWRALNYSKYFNIFNRDHRQALIQMHKDEVWLFGSPESGVGQGVFQMKLKHKKLSNVSNFSSLSGSLGDGAKYLAYGLSDRSKDFYRGCIEKGTFTVEFFFRHIKKEAEETFSDRENKFKAIFEEIIHAIKLMGLLGGLGSRKRRGWGSLTLNKLQFNEVNLKAGKLTQACGDEFHAPTSKNAFAIALSTVLEPAFKRGCGDNLQIPFSAFHKESHLFLWTTECEDNFVAMENLGKGYQLYRAWGRGGKVRNGVQSKKNFKDDHDWFKNELKDRPLGVPERASMGVPLGFSKTFIVDAPEPYGRRGSPLLFHIAKVGAKFLPVAVFFNTQFLPGNKLKLPKRLEEYRYNPQVILDYLQNNKRATTENFDPSKEKYFDGEELRIATVKETQK